MSQSFVVRRRIRLCMEGWYYLFVLIFIAGAAILRRANLLLILAAMLVAPLIFNWRFVFATLRKISLQRKTPRQITSGEVFDVEIMVENHRPRLDCWGIQIREQIEWEPSGTTLQGNVEGGSSEVNVVIEKIEAGNKVRVTYQCLLMKRGVYRLRPSRVWTTFPIGLVRCVGTVQNEELIYVSPPIGELSRQWAEWLKPIEVDEPRSMGQKGILDGMFHSIRDYRSGDSRRSIHWRSTAKLGKPAVKQFEQQADEEINIVLDLFQVAENDPTTDPEKTIELALSLVATLVDAACGVGRLELNLLLIGDSIQTFSAQTGSEIQWEICHQLASIGPASSDQTHEELDHFLSEHQFKAPVFVISTRGTIHDLDLQFESYLPITHFPGYSLRQSSGREDHLCWIDVSHANLDTIFHRYKDPAHSQLSAGASSVEEPQ